MLGELTSYVQQAWSGLRYDREQSWFCGDDVARAGKRMLTGGGSRTYTMVADWIESSSRGRKRQTKVAVRYIVWRLAEKRRV